MFRHENKEWRKAHVFLKPRTYTSTRCCSELKYQQYTSTKCNMCPSIWTATMIPKSSWSSTTTFTSSAPQWIRLCVNNFYNNMGCVSQLHMTLQKLFKTGKATEWVQNVLESVDRMEMKIQEIIGQQWKRNKSKRTQENWDRIETVFVSRVNRRSRKLEVRNSVTVDTSAPHHKEIKAPVLNITSSQLRRK